MSNGPGTDPESWLDLHGDAMFAFARLRVGDRSLAEDLVQDALLAAIGAAERFREDASERSWLIGILKHKIVDHLRRASRERTLGSVDADGEFDAQFDATGHWVEAPTAWRAPDRALENDQLGDALAACIERLPEKLRAAFVLREVDGLETAEVIETLDISSANNLWVMLSRARSRVRKCLDGNWFGRTSK